MEDERIAELEARLTDLENRFHNEVDEKLIGGLRKAKDTYDDNIAFDDFKGKYGEQIGKIDAGMKRASANPDYDTVREFYDAIKTVDGYKDGSIDVAKMIADKIEELAYRYNIPLEVEVTATEADKDADKADKPEDKDEAAEDKVEEVDEKKGCDDKDDDEKKEDDKEELPSDEKLDEIAKSVGL